MDFSGIFERNMRLLLTTLNAKYIHMNLAIRLLYDMNASHEGLAWKEFTIKEDAGIIASYCAGYDVVAFSCYIWNITPTLEVARRIKALQSDVKILLGGPEVSYDYMQVITNEAVDYIITGEGEVPFQHFLNAFPHVESTPSLVYKKEGEVVSNLPPPAFELSGYNVLNPYRFDAPEVLKTKVCYIETSRGCPYKCEFCLASLDNKVRYIPMDATRRNLLYLMEHARVIKFLDRTFNMKKDFTIEIFTFILEHYKPGNVFQFEITADIIHLDIVRFIVEKVPKGLFRFEIGIQTVNQKANLEVGRKQNFETTKRIIQSLQPHVEMHLDLIIGLPLDYMADIKHSFVEVFKLFAPELQLGFLKFLKGTPVREKYEMYDFVFDPMPPYQIIESKYLSRDELHRLTLLENALEIYWNGKRALHALKYITLQYDVFHFLMELGTAFDREVGKRQYSLDTIYSLLHDVVQQMYPDDPYLKQLVWIDYFLQHKIKPPHLFRTLEGLELTRLEAENGETRWRLDIPVGFDFHRFSQTLEVVPARQVICILYNHHDPAVIMEEGIVPA